MYMKKKKTKKKAKKKNKKKKYLGKKVIIKEKMAKLLKKVCGIMLIKGKRKR